MTQVSVASEPIGYWRMMNPATIEISPKTIASPRPSLREKAPTSSTIPWATQ